VYANLDGIAPVPRGLVVGTPQRRPFAWEIDAAAELPDLSSFPYLFGNPLKDMIEASPEWRARRGLPAPAAAPAPMPAPTQQFAGVGSSADDIPF
jgi:hypothetical protein